MQQDTMQEQWTRWEPASAVSGEYDSVLIHDNNEHGLTIILYEKDKTKQLHFNWQYPPVAYKKTQSRLTDMTIADLDESHGTNFFKVINSSYIKLISEQSDDISNCQPLEHFVIVIPNSTTLEILATSQPKVTLKDDMASNRYELKIGKLPDNSIAILRSHTKTGFPTLEVYNPIDRTSNKAIYYGEEKNEQ